jgi:hypothetical protein
MKLVIKTSLYYDARSEKHQTCQSVLIRYTTTTKTQRRNLPSENDEASLAAVLDIRV